ncbi:MAG: hypothetical protein HUU34_15455 [Saprospiraceae bacterium]|jgi:hypothetical protein|nr:hypothetical protein [Saprospiraceae bacterium]
MTILGNLFLGIAALVSILLFNLIYGHHNRSGDAGVGYAWSMLIGLLAFVVCMGIVAISIGVKGGYAWIGTNGAMRTVWVLGGFTLSMLGVFILYTGEGMGGLPRFLYQIVKAAPLLAILSVLLSALLLLNEPLRANLPTFVWRLPTFIAVGFGVVALGLILSAKARNNAAISKAAIESRDNFLQGQLNHVDTTDVMKDMVFLLVYTDANQKKTLREKALAKIKSRPDWQEELVRRLQNDWAPEAFTFLASNEVDDKAMFVEPIRQGVLIQARLVRENIRQCRDKYDLYEGKFTWEVDRVLRTVDKFQGMGTDYRPAVQELRKALDEPVSFEKPKLTAKTILDKWLEKH